jgi:2-keto-4-pentenoate hydratase/2-oxohepta-3-ene-1,7-dioic acid hydratase in catechol pathway
MKLARFRYQGQDQWGVVQGEDLYALEGELWGKMSAGARLCALSQAKLLPTVAPGNNAIGLAQTYSAFYAQAEKNAYRDGPSVFMKPSNTRIGQGDGIVFHAICRRLVYEAELGVIIGKRASRVSAEEALAYIGGYTCVNDVTCPRYSTIERPNLSTRFKTADTFCPCGPFVETDLDPQDATVICRVNGVEVQRSNTGQDMLYTVAQEVAWVSSFMTLEPGDMLCTGAVAVGPLTVGDVVEVDIPGIGVLRNPVLAP